MLYDVARHHNIVLCRSPVVAHTRILPPHRSSAEKVIAKSSLSNNHKNALNAVLFEAIDLVLHYHT